MRARPRRAGGRTSPHRDDIEADLARGDPEDLRDAFEEMVARDGASAIAGVATAGEPMGLFERVCAAMRGDGGRVPADTVRALMRGRGGEARAVDTYDGAARFALAARRTWWPAFSASLPAAD